MLNTVLVTALMSGNFILHQSGDTALSLARMNGHHQVVELLQRASTQPHKKVHC